MLRRSFSGQRQNPLLLQVSQHPDIKVQAVKRLGGQVVLHGDSFDIANMLNNVLKLKVLYLFHL